jgi:hypothetical protein
MARAFSVLKSPPLFTPGNGEYTLHVGETMGKLKISFLGCIALIFLDIFIMISCLSADDDDSDDDAGQDDDTPDADDDVDDDADDDTDGGDDSGGDDTGDDEFEAAKQSCVEAYVTCGLDEATAGQYCSFMDDYAPYWDECFSSALMGYFECLTDSDCQDVGCTTAFGTEIQNCI